MSRLDFSLHHVLLKHFQAGKSMRRIRESYLNDSVAFRSIYSAALRGGGIEKSPSDNQNNCLDQLSLLSAMFPTLERLHTS